MSTSVIGNDPLEPTFVCGVTDAECARAGGAAKWAKLDLTYAIVGFLPAFTQAEYRTIVRSVFDDWEAVCGIRADETQSTNANIIISAGRGRRVNFDGPSGVLAWCELPMGANPQQVRLMMDLDETWVEQGNGIHVPNVLCHELGHGLGLDHITSAKALMNPTYDRNVPKPLSPDIAQVVARYGQPRPRVTPQPTPTPEPQPSPTPTVPVTPTNGRTPITLTVGTQMLYRGYLEDVAK